MIERQKRQLRCSVAVSIPLCCRTEIIPDFNGIPMYGIGSINPHICRDPERRSVQNQDRVAPANLSAFLRLRNDRAR